MFDLFASMFAPSAGAASQEENSSWAFADAVNDLAGYDALNLEDDSRRSLLKDLERIYSEPHRAYHNRRHIVEVRQWTKRFTWSGKGPVRAAMLCAVLFHDAVYDPRASDNEARSADLAAEMLRPLKSKPRGFIDAPVNVGEIVEIATPIILATKRHESPKPGIDSALSVFLDGDLAILAANEDRYDEYARAIRREYDFVDDAAFAAKRAEILSGFLARDWLYHSTTGRRELEGPARKNVARELRALRRNA